jgi:coatomer subunit delta
MEVKGDMNLVVTDPDSAHVKIKLAPASADFGNTLQFKQHPRVAKFDAKSKDRIVALKDANASFPVGQGLSILKWRYTGTDESNVPLSSQLFLS